MDQNNHNEMQPTESIIPIIQRIKTEPGIDIVEKITENCASTSIRVKSLSSLQAEPLINTQIATIKQEPDDEIFKELEELKIKIERSLNDEQSSGQDTDNFIGSKNDPHRAKIKHEKTDNYTTENNDSKRHKKSKKRRKSCSLSSSDSSLYAQETSRRKSRKKYRSSSKEFKCDRKYDERRSRKRSTSRTGQKKSKSSRKRSRSRDKYFESTSRSNDFAESKKTENNLSHRSRDKHFESTSRSNDFAESKKTKNNLSPRFQNKHSESASRSNDFAESKKTENNLSPRSRDKHFESISRSNDFAESKKTENNLSPRSRDKHFESTSRSNDFAESKKTENNLSPRSRDKHFESTSRSNDFAESKKTENNLSPRSQNKHFESTSRSNDFAESKKTENNLSPRSRDKHFESISRSNDFAESKKTEDNLSPTNVLNVENSKKLVVEYNHGGMLGFEASTEPQPTASTKSIEENITTLNNLRPIIIKTDLSVLPQTSNETQIKQELVNEGSNADNDGHNDDDGDEVSPPLPIVTSIKVERNEILSQQDIKLEDVKKLEDISKKGVENAEKALEIFNNFKNNSYAGKFFYTASKIIQPPSKESQHKSPLFGGKEIYFPFSTQVVNYSDFDIISLPPQTAKIANLIGYDVSQLIDKLSKPEDNEESETKLIPKTAEVYSNIIQTVSTQTDMIPCIECAYNKLEKASGDEVKEKQTISIQTDPEIPIIKSLRTDENQLTAVNDIFELLKMPQSNDGFDFTKLRDRLKEILPFTNSPSTILQQPRILEPTPGILPNCVMQPTQQPTYPNNVNYSQSVQPFNSMQLGYQIVPLYLNSTQNSSLPPQQPIQNPIQSPAPESSMSPLTPSEEPTIPSLKPPQRPTVRPLLPSKTASINKNDPRMKQNDQSDLSRSSALDDLYGNENGNNELITKNKRITRNRRGRGPGRPTKLKINNY